jgi:hypothetical protein
LISEQVPSGNSLTTGRRSWIIMRMEGKYCNQEGIEEE